ncbi:MAG: hypothetical protein ACUVS6_03715 [Anaerolineae bacterium]
MIAVELIDWMGVARNALWILGLSIALASVSYASWQAHVLRCGLRRAFERAAFQVPFNMGLLLFSASLAWGAAPLWERLAWIGLALAFAWQVGLALRDDRAAPEPSSEERNS